MKKVITTCDVCKKEIGDNHIMLGSENGTELHFDNRLKVPIGGTQSIARYVDLHFCSQQHFVEYFFGKQN